MWRLVTWPRITSHIRDRILAAFPSIALPYMLENPYLFSYVLCCSHGSVKRYTNIKKEYSAQHWNSPATDISPPILSYPKLWGSLFHTGYFPLWLVAQKNSLWLDGIPTYGRFYLLWIEVPCPIGWCEDVQLETIYWFSAADKFFINLI